MVSQKMFNKAYALGADDLVNSWVGYKKYAVWYRDRWIHFGDVRYEDYTTHGDDDRRDRYRKRASKIKNRYGEYTYRNKNYPNFWAYHLLW
jgi:phage anti-repressor protein